MNNLEYILKKYDVENYRKPPITIKLDRWKAMPRLFKELGFTRGAEIGVAYGTYSENLFKEIPGLHLFCVDAWKKYSDYRDITSQAHFDEMYEETKTRLAPYNCTIVRDFSVSASHSVPDRSLDFVFIDGNHDFLHVTEDIHYWEKKVRIGGIVCGHDFRRTKSQDWKCHVKDVVGAWTYAHNINPWFVLQSDEKSSSWMWVKL